MSLSQAGAPRKPAVKRNVEEESRAKAARLYSQGEAAVKAKDFKKALEFFEQVNAIRPHDPEILNMLAFSHRKQGHLKKAFAYYEKALSLKSDFPEAREYLGGAHLQAALEHVCLLKSYGSAAEEPLRELREDFEEYAQKARVE